jgi:O-antigen/teichoic acid export membrane protein
VLSGVAASQSGGQAKGGTLVVLLSSVFGRCCLLVFVVSLLHTLNHDLYLRSLYAIGLTAATQIAFDLSSLTTYSVEALTRYSAQSIRSALNPLAYLMSSLVLLLPSMWIWITAGTSAPALVCTLLVGSISAAESYARYTRWIWQGRGEFSRFAFLDISAGIIRILASLLLLCTADLILTLGASLLMSANLVYWSSRACRQACLGLSSENPHVSRWRAIKETSPFGVSVLASSASSQLPAFFVGWLSGVGQGGIYSGATRVTQAAEVIPLSLASTFLPRLISQPEDNRAGLVLREFLKAAAVGALLAGFILLATPLVSLVVGLPTEVLQPILMILAAGLPLRFGIYILIASTIATGGVRGRLVVTISTSCLSVLLLTVFACHGARATSIIGVLSDIVLTVGLSMVTWRAMSSRNSGALELGAHSQSLQPANEGR